MSKNSKTETLEKLRAEYQGAKQERAVWKQYHERSWHLLTAEEKKNAYSTAKMMFEQWDTKVRKLHAEITRLKKGLSE